MRYEMTTDRLNAEREPDPERSMTMPCASSLAAPRYHWRTNLAVVLGVAAAVSVLAGALVVGDSVRGSLRDIALGRLGNTDQVVVVERLLPRRPAPTTCRNAAGVTAAAPLIVANGFVTHESSGRRAGERARLRRRRALLGFHGVDVPRRRRASSPALAAELGAGRRRAADRLQRPSEIPIESLFGRKDEVGRTVRLDAGRRPAARAPRRVLAAAAAGGGARRLCAAVADPARSRACPVRSTPCSSPWRRGRRLDTLRSTLRLEDLGARVEVVGDDPRRCRRERQRHRQRRARGGRADAQARSSA